MLGVLLGLKDDPFFWQAPLDNPFTLRQKFAYFACKFRLDISYTC